MHEASLAGGVLKLVEATRERERFRCVTRLRLEVGPMAGVEVRALRFALEAMAPGTCLEGMRLDIDEPPGSAWCLGCDHGVSINQRGEACPRCGSFRLQITGGTDLRVVDLMVAD